MVHHKNQLLELFQEGISACTREIAVKCAVPLEFATPAGPAICNMITPSVLAHISIHQAALSIHTPFPITQPTGETKT